MKTIFNLFIDILFKGKIPFMKFFQKIILFLAFVPILGIFILPGDYRNLGEFSWNLLLIILFLRPLGDIFVDFKFFRGILPLRKELGILCGSLGIAHGIGFFINAKIPFSEWLSQNYLWDVSRHYLWGMIGVFAAIILTISSNIFCVKILKKYWKKLHKITYIFVFVVAVHIVLIRAGKTGTLWDIDVWSKVLPVLILCLLWFLTGFKFKISFAKLFSKNKEKNKIRTIQVDRENCIGCTNCTRICPRVFAMKDGKSIPQNQPTTDDLENAQMAIEQCPVKVISWVGENENLAKKDIKKKLIFQYHKKLNEEVFLFTFSHSGLDFIPGQFLTLFFKDNEGEFPRSYSIFSADTETVTFCIHLLPDGRGSQKLANLEPKNEISYKGPFGNIKLQETNYPKVFIGTGTGIAPLFCMIKALPQTIQRTLFFGVRSEKDIFLKEELESIPDLFFSLSLSRPSENWAGKCGRVTDHISDKEFPSQTEFYICGNPKMVDSVREILQKKQIPETKIFFEHFS